MKSRRTSLPSATEQDQDFEVMSPSNALRHTHDHLNALKELTDLFRGKVVDVSNDCLSLELSAKPDRVDAFLKLLQPFGILEAARSGMMAMPRSLIYDQHESEAEEQEEDVGSGVDASMLPPG
jgi:acetolactate synthase-1/3 small subunit